MVSPSKLYVHTDETFQMKVSSVTLTSDLGCQTIQPYCQTVVVLCLKAILQGSKICFVCLYDCIIWII